MHTRTQGPESRHLLSEKTSETDDQRIKDVTPLPPPAHLIRFFPIQGTPIEALISRTRDRVKQILRGQSDRLLVVIGPCSIHDPAAAIEYATSAGPSASGWTTTWKSSCGCTSRSRARRSAGRA